MPPAVPGTAHRDGAWATLDECGNGAHWHPPGWRRSLQLVLATAWLLDGVLQLQPFMFTRGPHGFSEMLAQNATGNPGPVASSIVWAAGVVGAHSAPADLAFALIQILLGLGIAWRRSVKVALAASVPWALAVWWFGEGLGGILRGGGTPVLGGPGAVLVYALLAVLLWPPGKVGDLDASASPLSAEGSFAAASALGVEVSKALWAALWSSMAALSVVGQARSPGIVSRAIAGVVQGEPAWLADVDRRLVGLTAGRGLIVAVVIAVICLVVAFGIYLPSAAGVRAVLVVSVVTALAIWLATENFGAILAGGATDPNSGPLLALLALAYWPLHRSSAAGAPVPAAAAGGAGLAGAG